MVDPAVLLADELEQRVRAVIARLGDLVQPGPIGRRLDLADDLLELAGEGRDRLKLDRAPVGALEERLAFERRAQVRKGVQLDRDRHVGPDSC